MEFHNKHKKALLIGGIIVLVVLVALPIILNGRRNVVSGDYPYSPPTGNVPVETTLPESTPAHGPDEETTPPSVWNTIPDLGASYEQWLSAAMFLLLPREYPDFQLQGIYTASETDVSQSAFSQGAYIVFLSGGQEIWIHSAPLTEPRTESGVNDLYTAQLGYATFDMVEPGSVDLSAMQQQNVEDLAQLVDFSMLVTLHSR